MIKAGSTMGQAIASPHPPRSSYSDPADAARPQTQCISSPDFGWCTLRTTGTRTPWIRSWTCCPTCKKPFGEGRDW